MRFGELVAGVCVLFAMAAESASAFQINASIRTQDTTLELRALDGRPQLVSVQEQAGAVWSNSASERPIEFVFVAGRRAAVRWRLNPAQSELGRRRVAFVYECSSPKLKLTWEWVARSPDGPVEHTIRIENVGAEEIWLPLQESFSFSFPAAPSARFENYYVEKGAGAPSAEGTHAVALPVGYHWQGTSSTYAHTGKDEAREIIPFFAIEKTGGDRAGWYAGIEFSGRTRVAVERNTSCIKGSVGLNPEPGPFRTRLRPQETFETPTVFVGAFARSLDDLGNQLRRWVRKVLGHPHTWENPAYPLLVNNSWGSGMQVDEALALKMIRDSAELGLEMFHMDAGWFRGVGDWYPDPKKFPHGLAAVADNAHQQGLKFGLWVDWTQAALDTEPGALNLRDPKVRDWTVSDLPSDWTPEPFKGQTIDIGDPAAHEYAKREVFRIFETYHLDMLEHDGYVVAQGCVRSDHPHAAPDPASISVTKQDGSYIVLSANSTDVSYHAVRAYYDIYRALRERHPGALLEVCNDGGRMVDFGSAAHADYFSITDGYDPVSNRRAFYDASHLLPAAMLECYVEKWPAPRIENFRYMLRSGMQGWLTIMQDTNAWSAEQHAAAKAELQLYKAELRPLIREADIFHVGPRPDGVHGDATEFFDARTGHGVVYAFRGSGGNAEYNYKLRGLDPGKRYRVRYHDGSARDFTASGRELTGAGLRVTLSIPNSSELVFIDASR